MQQRTVELEARTDRNSELELIDLFAIEPIDGRLTFMVCFSRTINSLCNAQNMPHMRKSRLASTPSLTFPWTAIPASCAQVNPKISVLVLLTISMLRLQQSGISDVLARLGSKAPALALLKFWVKPKPPLMAWLWPGPALATAFGTQS